MASYYIQWCILFHKKIRQAGHMLDLHLVNEDEFSDGCALGHLFAGPMNNRIACDIGKRLCEVTALFLIALGIHNYLLHMNAISDLTVFTEI